MISNHQSARRRFRVRLGHLKVDVDAFSREEAIVSARTSFRRDLPRLWDLITRLEPERFQVTPIASAAPLPRRKIDP